MRVGINALLLSSRAGYRRTGVSRYIERLVSALPTEMPDGEIVAYAGGDVRPSPASTTWRRPMWPVDRAPARIGWELAVLPVQTRRDGIDLFHGTVNVVPRGLSCPSVVTFHDLALLRWPEQVTRRRHAYLSRQMRDAAERAARILTVSEATKDDVVELLGVDPARIAVAPLGVDERFMPVTPDGVGQFRAKHGLERPFVLFVGTLEPRKNLPALLRAFAAIRDDVPHDLVIAGAAGWKMEAFALTLRELDLGDRVRLLGFVDDDGLPALYSAADLFAFPSLYEGFGLPVLEAMACGAPVLTSRVSSLPEVAGEAAILIDPADESGMAAEMGALLHDPDRRAAMAVAGRLRAALFTWRRTAALTAAAYREALR